MLAPRSISAFRTAHFLRRVVRIFAWTAATLITLALLLVVYAFIVNCFDEPLSPQAKALLAEPAHAARPEDNLYLALMGFQAPAGETPIAAGKQRVDRYNAAVDRMLVDLDAAMSFSATDMPRRIEFSGDSEFWAPLAHSPWETAKSHRADLLQARKANAILLNRYQSLHELKRYDETSRPSYVSSFPYVPPAIRTLYLGDIAARLQSTRRAQQLAALQDLGADRVLWKTVVTGEGNVVGKLLAMAALRTDDLLLADLIADPATNPDSLVGELQTLLRPFASTDWSLDRAFAAEYRAMDAVLRPEVLANAQVGGSGTQPIPWASRQWNALGMHFFKLHATENLRAEHMAHNIALSTVGLDHYESQLASYNDWASRDAPWVSPAALYNPMGRMLAFIGRGAYSNYQTRAYDSAALQRLPVCVYEIRTQHVTADAVVGFITQHPDVCSHVIPGHPFHWDPKTRELTVTPLGKGGNPGQRWSVVLRFL